MTNRRKFLQKTGLSSLLAAFGLSTAACSHTNDKSNNSIPTTTNKTTKPSVIATWNNQKATAASWKVLASGGSALDAVEKGVQVPEADPKDQSVGYGGRPDREGKVTLDACIMDENGDCGSVCFLQHIKHPISVAR